MRDSRFALAIRAPDSLFTIHNSRFTIHDYIFTIRVRHSPLTITFRGGVLMTPDDFFAFAKKNEAEKVDLKFVDMLGSWQHCSFPIDHLDKNTFTEGLGFDGSSIRGWMGIHESDMLAIPDPDTTRLDPFFAKPTVSVIANIIDPVTG